MKLHKCTHTFRDDDEEKKMGELENTEFPLRMPPRDRRRDS